MRVDETAHEQSASAVGAVPIMVLPERAQTVVGSLFSHATRA